MRFVSFELGVTLTAEDKLAILTGITVTYVDGPFDARVIFGSGFACVQSYVRPV